MGAFYFGELNRDRLDWESWLGYVRRCLYDRLHPEKRSPHQGLPPRSRAQLPPESELRKMYEAGISLWGGLSYVIGWRDRNGLRV
ncbi:MAG: hypothetical protein V2A58_11315 [Planctomycetota bacterium]